MRVIVRKERPHPGAQLRFTDVDGLRFTAFGTDTKQGQLADLELRHRRRARCEDRIRGAKDTGLRNLPLKGFTQNQLWCEIVALACELLAWTQMLALAGTARRWEPNGSGCASSPGGGLARGGRRLRLRLAERWPWAGEVTPRSPPAGPPLRVTSRTALRPRKREPRGPWNPAHPARQPGSQARPGPENHPPADTSGRADQRRERSRLRRSGRGGRSRW